MAFYVAWARKNDTFAETEAIHRKLKARSIISTLHIARGQIPVGSTLFNFHVQDYPTAFHNIGDRYSIRDNSATIFSGLAWLRNQDHPRIMQIADFEDALEKSGGDVQAQIGGEFSLLSCSNHGIISTSDKAGLFPTYYCETANCIAISNFPEMIASALGSDDFNSRHAANLTAIGYPIGEDTWQKDIKKVPQSSSLEFSDGKLRIVGARSNVFFTNTGDLDDLIEDGARYAIQAIQVANPGNGRIRLPITGGKDSRMVLSLAIAAGLKDRLTLFTKGDLVHPDVTAGKVIAAQLGLPHETVEPPDPKPPAAEMDQYLKNIAKHTKLNGAMISAWDAHMMQNGTVSVTMTGHMGEVLKSNAKHMAKDGSVIASIARAQALDPMNVLRPEAHEEFSSRVAARVEEVSPTGKIEDVPDVFYYTERIPNWLGSFAAPGTVVSTKVRPLNSPSLLAAAWQLGEEGRKQERIHFEIIKRLSPELLNIPFAAQTWSESLEYQHPGLNTKISLPMPKQGPVKAFGGWQHLINRAPQLRNEITKIFEAQSDLTIWNFVDFDAVKARLANNNGMSLGEMIRLLGLLTAVFKEAGLEDDSVISIPEKKAPFAAYAATPPVQ